MTIGKRVIFLAVATMSGALSSIAYAGDDTDHLISDVDVFGRIMFDYAYAEGENTSFRVDETELRNARLGLSGKIAETTKFKIELHTDDSGDVKLTDAYLAFYPGKDNLSLKIGQIKTPLSLDKQTSSRFTALHERSAFTNAFDINRRVGAMVAKASKTYTVSLGVFGDNLESDHTFGNYAIAGRATFSPVTEQDDFTVHTGVSLRYRNLDDAASPMRYRQRPVTHIPGRILSTGSIAESDIFAGIEAAMIKGPFWAAAEYAVTFTECSACVNDPTLSGGYLEAGFMIGGKRVLKGGKFYRPKLDGGRLGAASFVVRYDSLDLDSNAVDGGDYGAFIAGADWWPTDHIRIGVNGFIVDAKLGTATSGLASTIADAVTLGLTEEKVKGITLRAQYDF